MFGEKAIEAASDFGKSITGVISEYVEDKDLAKKINLELEKESLKFSNTIVVTSTIPWVDATVKLMYAARDCLIPMFRPIGSVFLALVGAYLAKQGVDAGQSIEGIAATTGVLEAPLIQYIHSRGAEKREKQKLEAKKEILNKQSLIDELIDS